MPKNSFVHYLTKVLLEVMFYGGSVCCIAIPFLAPALMRYLEYREAVILPLTVALFLSGLCILYIVWHLKAMYKTLLGGNPFTCKNVSSLRKCAVSSFLIAVIFILDMIVTIGGISIISCLLAIMFSLLGLFCLTLKDVFKQAIAYKEENDWTV